MSASATSLNSQLETSIRDFEQAKADARALLSGASEHLLSKRPSPESWSVLECIAHLNLSSDAMLPEIKRAVAEAGQLPKIRNSAYKMDFPGRLLAWSLEPPARLKFKTSAFAQPVAHAGSQETLAQFEQQQDELIQTIRSAADLPIDRCKIKSPFGNMSYNVYSALRIIAAHNRRHLWQARNALKRVALP